MSQEEQDQTKERQRQRLDDELGKFQRQVTLMFVDIVGSTTYFDRYGDVAGLVWVHKCIDMLIPIAEQHGGTISKTIGDAVMTYYEDPVQAVRAAMDMQRNLEAYNQSRPEPDQVRVRIGLNYGKGLIKEKDVFGDVVNVAARIESMAKGEQIFVSSALEEKIRPQGFPVKKISEVTVKGKAEKLDVYEVMWREVKGGAPIRKPSSSPTIAARVNLLKALQQPGGGKSTLVMSGSPVAAVAKTRAEYSLVVVRPDGSPGQACKLEKQVTVLGRVEGDIVFPDDTLVSRRHARFTLGDSGVMVEDLNSANGVFWRLRTPHNLHDGDIILMGRQMFRFYTGQAAAEGSRSAADKKEEKPPAELVRLLPGGVEETRYPLQSGENILGRTRGTLTFPQDAYLSSQHARVKFENGKFILEDLQAANGTFVGVRERTTLGDGDIVLVGHQLLRITGATA